MRHTCKCSNDPGLMLSSSASSQPLQYRFRLHAGDVIRFAGRLCRVVRVSQSEAVVIINRPIRDFKTRFDKPVRFQPLPPFIFPQIPTWKSSTIKKGESNECPCL